tara:strand:+ start:15 stop:1691 length:1677 start_codon:yes stop_codon:yes gene_type:complete
MHNDKAETSSSPFPGVRMKSGLEAPAEDAGSKSAGSSAFPGVRMMDQSTFTHVRRRSLDKPVDGFEGANDDGNKAPTLIVTPNDNALKKSSDGTGKEDKEVLPETFEEKKSEEGKGDEKALDKDRLNLSKSGCSTPTRTPDGVRRAGKRSASTKKLPPAPAKALPALPPSPAVARVEENKAAQSEDEAESKERVGGEEKNLNNLNEKDQERGALEENSEDSLGNTKEPVVEKEEELSGGDEIEAVQKKEEEKGKEKKGKSKEKKSSKVEDTEKSINEEVSDKLKVEKSSKRKSGGAEKRKSNPPDSLHPEKASKRKSNSDKRRSSPLGQSLGLVVSEDGDGVSCLPTKPGSRRSNKLKHTPLKPLPAVPPVEGAADTEKKKSDDAETSSPVLSPVEGSASTPGTPDEERKGKRTSTISHLGRALSKTLSETSGLAGPIAENSEAKKAGYLTKQGGNFKSWKRRWFVLQGIGLNYYKGNKPIVENFCGNIPLSGASINESSEVKGRKYLFEIETPGRKYHLCADSLEEMQEWICAIKIEIEIILFEETKRDGKKEPVSS